MCGFGVDPKGGDEDGLQGAEGEEARGHAGGEAVGMEADIQEIDAEPREGDDDVEEGEGRVERVGGELVSDFAVMGPDEPENDEEGSVFFGVPTPETAPGLVGPDTAEDGADGGEEEGDDGEAEGEFVDFYRWFEEGDVREAGSDDANAVADGDAQDMGGEPEICVEDSGERIHGFSCWGGEWGDEEQEGRGEGSDIEECDLFAFDVEGAGDEDADEGYENDGFIQRADGGAVEDVNAGGYGVDVESCGYEGCGDGGRCNIFYIIQYSFKVALFVCLVFLLLPLLFLFLFLLLLGLFWGFWLCLGGGGFEC